MKALLISFSMLCTAIATAAPPEVPFGDVMGDEVKNYNRLRSQIATGGVIKEGGLVRLKELGFKTIVDLRTTEEGAADEQKTAELLGLSYYNLPTSRMAPDKNTMVRFSSIIEETSNYPLLVHCASANRVGTAWAIYRATHGVPLEIAIEEGLTTGMNPARIVQVKAAAGEQEF